MEGKKFVGICSDDGSRAVVNANPWEQRKLGDLVDRVTRKNQDLVSELPLTISAQYGLIDQNEFFDKRVASSKFMHRSPLASDWKTMKKTAKRLKRNFSFLRKQAGCHLVK